MSDNTRDWITTAVIILALGILIMLTSGDSVSLRFRFSTTTGEDPPQVNAKLEAIHEEINQFCGFKIEGITDVELHYPPEPHETHYDIILQLVDKKSGKPIERHSIHSRWRDHLTEVIRQEKFKDSLISWADYKGTEENRDPSVIYVWTDVTGSELCVETSLDVLEQWGTRALNALVKATNESYFKADSKIDKEAIKAFQERAANINFEE